MKNTMVFLCFLTSTTLSAQPVIQWQKCLGGNEYDAAYAILPTNDGGYILTGDARSADGDASDNHGSNDALIVKLDQSGSIQWKKCLGGSGSETLYAVQPTNDGGYIFTGYSGTPDGDVTANNGASDVWVVKLDQGGAIQWQKSYGGNKGDYGRAIQPTSDGGYILACETGSTNVDVLGFHGLHDFWVIKLDNAGSIEWQKCYGGSAFESPNSIQPTNDGGYILAGETYSKDGDITDPYGGLYDAWILKIDSVGTIQWDKCLGGSDDDNAEVILQTSDGGYIVTALTASNDYDVTGSHGSFDFWLVKLDQNGVIQWQKCLGGSGLDWPKSMQITTDGGYILAGYSASTNDDITNYQGGNDCWLVKVDTMGTIQWQKNFGGWHDDRIYAIQQISESDYVFAGVSSSNQGDVSGHHGNGDYWVVKLGPATGVEDAAGGDGWEIFPNPAHQVVEIRSDPDNPMTKAILTDILGRQVTEQYLYASGSIDVSRLPAGMYVINAQMRNGKTLQKIMVKQ